MPAVEPKPNSLILVTGASGFIGTHTVEAILDAGFNVRVVVRTTDKGEYLVKTFAHKKRTVEYAVVPDMTTDGAYDRAVIGISGVAHLASPVSLSYKGEPDDMIVPAVHGTTRLLESLKLANLKGRIVLMSSIVSVNGDVVPGPRTYTEKDWNTTSEKLVKELGKDSEPNQKYRASKTAAERAFWKFFKDNKVDFDGVAVNPALVFGPLLHDVSTIEDVSDGSVAFILPWAQGKASEALLNKEYPNINDVRDLAQSVVKALTIEAASGERYIISSGPLFGNDFARIVARDFPDIKGTVPNESPAFIEQLEASAIVFDGSKGTRELGIKYREKAVTIHDTLASLREKVGI